VEPVEILREDWQYTTCGSRDSVVLFNVRGGERRGIHCVDGILESLTGSKTTVCCQDRGLVYVGPQLAVMCGISTYSATEAWAYSERLRERRRQWNRSILDHLERLPENPERVSSATCSDGPLSTLGRRQDGDIWGLQPIHQLVSRIDGMMRWVELEPTSGLRQWPARADST
jgi:hypothetical protein